MDTPHCSLPCYVPSRNTRRGVILALSLLMVCVGVASDAWGRAGGGGGGGGGGGSYSSSYSSSSGGGGGGGDMPAPCICLIVLGLGFLAWKGEVDKRRKAHGSKLPAEVHSRVVGRVQAVDPSFAVETLLEDFKSAFVAIQEAWMAQDMAAVRHFVSDGIDEKFAVQFREQQRLGYREQLDKITVHHVCLARFESDGLFEVLTVEVVASMVDQRVALEAGTKVGGSSQAEPFTEYWSLVRRQGTQSRQDGGRLLAGSCPNCGNPLQLNRLGSCHACDSLVRSGVYDWVLCEITQQNEWQLEASVEVATRVRDYRQQFDPGFSRQHLEDRAWVIVARKGLSDASRELAPLRKVALPKFTDRYEVPQEAMGTHFSINGLDLVGFVVEDAGHFTLLHVDWWRNDKSRDSLLVLHRQSGVQSNQDMALLSAHCPSCGAPEESQATDACVSCGQVTNTGKFDWVLLDFIDDQESRQAHIWLRKMTPAVSEVTTLDSGPERRNALRKRLQPAVSELTTVDSGPERRNAPRKRLQPAACLMWAIGELVRAERFTDAEQRLLARCASRNRIAAAEFAEWVERAQRGELVSPRPADDALTQTWLDNFVRLLFPDGTIDAETTALLMRLARIVGMPDYDVALAARKLTYWEMASRRLSDLSN